MKKVSIKKFISRCASQFCLCEYIHIGTLLRRKSSRFFSSLTRDKGVKTIVLQFMQEDRCGDLLSYEVLVNYTKLPTHYMITSYSVSALLQRGPRGSEKTWECADEMDRVLAVHIANQAHEHRS